MWISGGDHFCAKSMRRTSTYSAALHLISARIADSIQRARSLGGEATRWAEQLQSTWTEVLAVTELLVTHPDRVVAMANSSIYLEAFGHTVIAWMWLDQINAVAQRTGAYYDGKRCAASYFFRYELPKVSAHLDLLADIDITKVNMNSDRL